jgi:hypothetical protein
MDPKKPLGLGSILLLAAKAAAPSPARADAAIRNTLANFPPAATFPCVQMEPCCSCPTW